VGVNVVGTTKSSCSSRRVHIGPVATRTSKTRKPSTKIKKKIISGKN
jgi:hypothetical protein